MAVIVGLQQMREREEAIEKARASQGLSDVEFKIGADRIANIRFITDGDLFEFHEFHSLPRETKKHKTFYEQILCLGDDCELCTAADEEVSKTRTKMFAWIYAHSIMHPEALENSVEVKRAGMTFWKEKVGQFKMFKQGPGWQNSMTKKFTALMAKYGTLSDRDYEWIRQGERLNTTYDIYPEDPSKISKEILTLAKSLPSITDYVNGVGEVPIFGAETKEAGNKSATPLLERLKQEREAKEGLPF